MTDKIVPITVEILAKSYNLRCSESEATLLQKAAQRVDKVMRETKDAGKVLSLDKLAIIASLSIAYQLLLLEQDKDKSLQSVLQRISNLQHKLERALSTDLTQLELVNADYN